MSDANDTNENRDNQYSDVSLRAVELLARAQRTADEAVAEAQNYARDLEASARTQYAQILHSAQVAARDLKAAKGGGSDTVDTAGPAAPEAVPAGLATEVDYVRTYARVAHAQVRTVLTALSDELDHLAALASGRPDAEVPPAQLPPATVEASWPSPPARVPSLTGDDRTRSTAPAPSDDAADADSDDSAGAAVASPRAATGKLWTRDDSDHDRALSGARTSGWRGALQRKG